jgi:hypothetical protein
MYAKRRFTGEIHKMHPGGAYTACGQGMGKMKEVKPHEFWRYVMKKRCKKCWV